MPVNATSTGATYGKSSDPLCPLGFHPQVRWPTRCKRCFRDYKEHLDDNDRAKYGNIDQAKDDNPWNDGRRQGFNKSKSLDVTTESQANTVNRGWSVAPQTQSSESEANNEDIPAKPVANFGRNFETAKPKAVVNSGGGTFQGIPKVQPQLIAPKEKKLVRSQSAQPDPEQEPTPSWVSERRRPTSATPSSASKPCQECQNKKEVENELKVMKTEVEKLQKSLTSRDNSSQNDLKKAKDKIGDQERTILELQKEKKKSLSKVKELEESLEKQQQQQQSRPQYGLSSGTSNTEHQKKIRDLEAKLRLSEKMCKDLEAENDRLQSSVQNLEGELDEVQDNFREDEADEYRTLKRELENASKNCRVLTFKLKKAEKNYADALEEKEDLEKRVKNGANGGSNLDAINKIRKLEKELEQKNMLLSQKKSSMGPVLSRTGSIEKSLEDQLLKDLQDSIERENDLKEQLNMAEEDARDFRVKIGRLEDENESLVQQVKKMRRNPSSAISGKKSASSDEDECDLRLQLEVSEQESAVLRKKVESLLTDNLKLTKDMQKLNEEKKKQRSSSSNSSSWRLSPSNSFSSSSEDKMEELQTELNETRVKLIEKERECERLSNQIKAKHGSASKKSSTLEVIEKEAEILRQRNSQLEAENDRLSHENKQFNLKYGRKLPASTNEKLQMDKFALEEKVKELEKKLQFGSSNSSSSSSSSTTEVNKLRREKSNLEHEVANFRSTLSGENEKRQKVERDLSQKNKEMDKIKSELNETKKTLDKAKNEKDKLQKEYESVKSKNTSNLHQTQEGIKAFKEQIETLKKEMSEEKNRVKDLEDKWAKSKRINQQRKDKIDSLEKQINNSPDSRGMRLTIEKQKKQIRELEEQLDETGNGEEEEKETLERELTALRATYNQKADQWIKEKLDLQKKMRDLEDSIRNSAGEGWDLERERFKQIIDDRDSQITQLKIEGDVARSQASSIRKECDDLKVKVLDYEKMSKFQKVVSTDSEELNTLKQDIESLKKQLNSEQRDKKSELNLQKMKMDGKIALLSEEVQALKAQNSKYRRERETYKEMVEGMQKKGPANKPATDKERVAELQLKLQEMEDELSEAKMETSQANASAIASQSNAEIQIAELKSRLNEMEEESLIESGRARIAGTRTKMELAWQKERESQKKLISELNTMARDLKSTLLEMEREKERERLEGKRKVDTMKAAFDDEHDDARKQITDLQYDLLELRDAHAKLRTTNDKLRRDRDRLERDREEVKAMIRDRSRSEQGEDKKMTRFLTDIDQFLDTAKKTIQEGRVNSLHGYLKKLKESKDELEQLRRLAEEERNAKRLTLMKRGNSMEKDTGDMKGRSPMSVGPPSAASRRYGYRKTLSVGGDAEDQIWRSVDSTTGSRESLASNASIPLPVPVRTRSSHNNSDEYKNIRRLERDTSMDRMSTGSRESNRSTQSEWVTGRDKNKKNKAGLIGKLKKLTRGMSAEREREFGSGSDISSVSVASKASTNVGLNTLQRKSSVKKDKNDPAKANEPFDAYFQKGQQSGLGVNAAASRARQGYR